LRFFRAYSLHNGHNVRLQGNRLSQS